MSLVEQELLTLPEHLGSSPIFSEFVLFDLLVFCVMFCRSLFVLLSFFFDHCMVYPSLTIVWYILLWPLYGISFFDHCIVYPSLTIVWYILLWPLYGISFFDHCMVYPSLTIVWYILLWPLYGISFFDWRLLLISTLVCSNRYYNVLVPFR